MPIEVETPDGNVAEFPDGTSKDVIKAALQKRFGAPKAGATPTPAPERPAMGRVITDDKGRALSIPQLGQPGLAVDPSTTEGKINNLMALGAGGISGISAAGGVLPFAANTARGLVGGVAGGWLGEHADRMTGAPGIFKAAGGIAGSLYGAGGGNILALLKGGKEGLVKNLLSRLPGAAEGGEGAAVATQAERSAATQLAARKAEADIAAKQALASARTAQAERVATLRAQAEERHALQKQILERRLAGRAPLNTPTPPAVQPAPAVEAAAPATAAPAAAAQAPAVMAADQQRTVLALQQQMATKEGRRVVLDWLNKQPKEVADPIRLLLARRQAQPATVAGPLFDASQPARSWVGDPSKVQKVSEISSELARMLGQ